MTTDAHRIHGHDELSRLDILRGCRPFIKDSHQAALQVEQTAFADALKSLSRSSLGATDQSSKDAPRGLVASVLMTLL